MRWLLLRRLILVPIFLSAPAGAVAVELNLESREYKLALDPAKFDFREPQKTAGEFWTKLTQIIDASLGKGAGGKVRFADSSFDKSKQRRTVFRDTKECVLNAVGYSVRERIKFKDGALNPESRELTLKFRTSDMMAAQEFPDSSETKFEEDVAPLLVRKIDASGVEKGAFAQPPSMRSIFSVSVDKKIKPAAEFKTIADVAKHFEDFRGQLNRAGGDKIDLGAALAEGQTFHELVFEGAEVFLDDEFKKEAKAKFDLSLWYREGQFKTEPPALAEISYKYDVEEAEPAGLVARRALALFKAMQSKLDGWTSPDRETKTAAALPKDCQ
jgi:hypothetical protein